MSQSRLGSGVFTGVRYHERCRFCGAQVHAGKAPKHDDDCPVPRRRNRRCVCGLAKDRGQIVCELDADAIPEVWDERRWGSLPDCRIHGDPVLMCRGCGEGGREL